MREGKELVMNKISCCSPWWSWRKRIIFILWRKGREEPCEAEEKRGCLAVPLAVGDAAMAAIKAAPRFFWREAVTLQFTDCFCEMGCQIPTAWGCLRANIACPTRELPVIPLLLTRSAFELLTLQAVWSVQRPVLPGQSCVSHLQPLGVKSLSRYPWGDIPWAVSLLRGVLRVQLSRCPPRHRGILPRAWLWCSCFSAVEQLTVSQQRRSARSHPGDHPSDPSPDGSTLPPRNPVFVQGIVPPHTQYLAFVPVKSHMVFPGHVSSAIK